MLLHKNGGGYFEKNDVCSNGLDGFLIREVNCPFLPDQFHFQSSKQGAKPKLVRNRINRNGQYGIQVLQGGWASVRECDMRGMLREFREQSDN